MNCKKCRANIFEYRDGTLSPQQKVEMEAHLAACPRCRVEFEAAESLARGIQESYTAATTSLSFDPDKARLAGREIAIASKGRSNASAKVAGKPRVFRWLAVGAGAAIILAAVLLGPFKSVKRGAFLAGGMEGQSSNLRSDDLPDPFQDWIQGRVILTIEDKAAGTTEKYLTDRAGAIRKIAEQGRN